MPGYSTESLRNIALTGHTGSGKTTLVEALLARTGAIGNAGSVEQRNTVTDFEELEKLHGHSLETALTSLEHVGRHINLIDTPGAPDLLGRALAVLPAVETCAVVINAPAGIERVSQQMLEAARERNHDCLIIINHIDADGVDLAALLSQICETFGAQCLPLNLPAERGSRVVDCFFEPESAATDFAAVATAHTEIVDQVVELDEALMELYLEQGQSLSAEQLHAPFEAALREGHLIPVCFVSARTGAGIDQLLRIFAELMPNPAEGNPPLLLKDIGDQSVPITVVPDPDRHVLAHVFKVVIDPFVGKLAVFRIHQGSVTRDSQLFIGDARKPFRVAHLFTLKGGEHAEIERGIPGDICAVAKIEAIDYDAVLHDSHEEDHIHLRPLDMPQPMYGLAIKAKSRGDEQKISETLHKLAAEDPSLRVEYHASLNETVLRGQGELHLRLVLEKLKTRYHVEVETCPPRIAYRETITVAAEGHHRHKKQSGGAGQFGEVYLRIEPLPRGGGFEFVDAVVGGAIPRQFIPAVEKGVRQAMEEGAIAGYPLQDIRVTVYDGKHHSVDSKEVAFVSAGRKAFLDAVSNARPVVLEPLVTTEIETPAETVGDITSDLAARRGRINDTRPKNNGTASIAAAVPLAELENYSTRLQSMTGGIGHYSMTFSHYEPVPPHIQQNLTRNYKSAGGESSAF